MLETDYPSGRTWASLFSASDNSSEYKYGHEDELSPLCVGEVRLIILDSSSRRTSVLVIVRPVFILGA